MSDPARIEFLGAPGSPYTRKMLAILRYRRIAHNMLWGGHRGDQERYPKPKVRLLPTFYFPKGDGEFEAVVDSTFILRRLEGEYKGRAVIPSDPALGFLNYLIEDFADEWLTKAMFHYRWAYQADIDNAGPLLTFWHNPQLSADEAAGFSDYISQRQIERLYVVGSNDVTAKTIEDSYERLIAILSDLIQAKGYVLGARPSSADFALYGQLTQLALVDPTPAAILNKRVPRLRAWIDRVDDLSGLEPQDSDWLSSDGAADRLKPLLAEIGRVYTPFLLANAAAVQNGEKSFTTMIDGREWSQPTFPYQAKCLGWLRDEFAAMPAQSRKAVVDVFAVTGCTPLIEGEEQ